MTAADSTCNELGSGDADTEFTPSFSVIPDNYRTMKEVTDAIKQAGLGSCNLIFGIDYTMSNRCQGQHTFGGKSLHYISDSCLNPYQQVICSLGETLGPFDDDGIIPAYGFGDHKTRDQGIFPLKEGGYCEGFHEVLERYEQITPTIRLGGPTNFAPLIRKAIEIVADARSYHILVIVADGQVTSEGQTKEAIVEASNYPLSIIVIGVGDGPWHDMKNFDDGLHNRKFDNFQFVDHYSVTKDASNVNASLALHALMEIPDQYKTIKKLGMLA